MRPDRDGVRRQRSPREPTSTPSIGGNDRGRAVPARRDTCPIAVSGGQGRWSCAEYWTGRVGALYFGAEFGRPGQAPGTTREVCRPETRVRRKLVVSRRRC